MGLFAGHGALDQAELDNFGVDWVIHYSFEDVGKQSFLPIPSG